ncbi:MAG: helix-turn-helix transcriptional regulator [Myxococcota bacterium]
MDKSPPGQRLRQYRLDLGLTQDEFGERTGVIASTISYIEAGRRYPGRRLAGKIEAMTRAWEGGVIRTVDWDRAEDLARGRPVDWHVHAPSYASEEPTSPEAA